MTTRRRPMGSPARPHGHGPSDGAASTVISYMVAIGLFFAIIVMALSYIGLLTRPATDAGDIDLDSKASNVLEVLTSSPGVPSDWEENPATLQRLGLLRPGTTITMSQAKLKALQPGGGVTYEDARDALGLASHQFHLDAEPQFQGAANRTAIDGYRLAYVAKYESGNEDSGSVTESKTLENTSVRFNNTLADDSGVFSNPGDEFKDDTAYLQRHLIPRMAGLWYNDDGGSSSATAWRVLDTDVHDRALDPAHRNVLSTSEWDDGSDVWTFSDGDDDRIFAVKANLSDYDGSDTVWFNFTHHANGYENIADVVTDGGQVQTRRVDSITDSWDTENDGRKFWDNGTTDAFDSASVHITDAKGENTWIAFRWSTSGTDANSTGGWFISDWTLEAVHDGKPVVLANNTLDYNTTNVDVLVTGKGIEHGQFSEDDQSQDKDPIQQWIHAGGDVFGLAPENPSATQWLGPWVDGGGADDHGPFTIVDSRSNTTHSLLTNPTSLDWRDWDYTTFHWNIDPTDKFNWVLAASEQNGDEIAPVLALSEPDAPGEGNLILSSQDSEAVGETQRQWFMENSLVTLRYRGLFLTFGDASGGNHTVGSADTVGLVDATEGQLDYPNYEISVDVWR